MPDRLQAAIASNDAAKLELALKAAGTADAGTADASLLRAGVLNADLTRHDLT